MSSHGLPNNILSPPKERCLSRYLNNRPLLYVKRAAIAASYPLRGIWYFTRNKEFWPLLFGRLVPLSLISFFVYFVLFSFAFLPQFLFLAIFHGWGAWFNAVVLVLGEGLVIVQGLFEGFFVDECRVDVFDATLIKLSLKDLISPHRLLFEDAPDAVKMLGKPTSSATFNPWSTIQVVELIFFLPLNLIPYVGTFAFIVITGTRLGKLSHHRWFQLRGLTKPAQAIEIKTLEWEYIWFGTVAMILELIPVLSFFFLLTTATGAAMWAADLEKSRRREAESDARQAAASRYTDDFV
ncbi:hypothetical protein THARTR1_04511 [Trichoderma harzianum]|uniref:Outer spore wall protein RRT8 n=1 Tax=Trichoderma harzianum TaxID=5544 RepID=A0A2K0UC67_TRIHA|nr:hypothetical protein THARTR1_04511 [Trichoderma harzianum]